MPDINSLAAEFGSAGVSPPADTNVDVHSLAAEFGSDKKAKEIKKDIDKGTITIRPVTPPISGPTEPLLQPETTVKGGVNPRSQDLGESIKNLPSNVGKAIIEKASEGRALASEGVSDIGAGKPATGALKVAGGSLAALTSPITGTVQETVEKPVTELTGNPDIGSRAGFVVNSAIPVVPGTKAAVAALPKNRAFRTLVESITPEKAGEVAAAMKANPRLTPADLSPKVKQDTQNLFVTDGKHINYLANTVENRLNTAKQAVEGAMNTSLGTTVNAVDKLKELKKNIKDVGANEINPVIAAKPHTDITSVVKHIDALIGPTVLKAIREGVNNPLIDDTKRALYSIRNDLRGDWPDRDKMFSYTDQLHKVQSELRMKAEALKNSSSGWDRLLSNKLFKIREEIKDAIGPEYKKALSKYKDELDIENAFNHGHDAILNSSKTMENRPEFFKQWVDKASPEELNAAREGARIAIDTQINGFKHAARRGTDIGEVEFNKQRIEALFGKTEADKLFTTLKHERAIADTNAKLVQGSQTAMRNSSKAAFALPTPGEGARALLPPAIVEGAGMLSGAPGGLGTAAYMGAKLATSAKDRINLLLQKEHNMQYAKMALPTEGPSREALIKGLEQVANQNSAKPFLLRRGATSLSRIVSP